MKSVIRLQHVENVKQFGGKAVNLGAMLRNGLPTPDGLAVGLSAFNDDGKLLDTSKVEIHKILKYGKLYAVRSSATVEDSSSASWAGQFESFLNIPTSKIFEKIEQCRNSVKLRAKSYADQNAESEIQIAVVVQEMIKPTYAGVLFTVDPISGANHLVTEYVKGLGEDLVGGHVDPERITWRADDKIDAPFDIDQLTNLARNIEKVFGSHQDIEWAYDSQKMWLVQARPITTKSEEPVEMYLGGGEPEDLFYWGPSRAEPKYISDFITATEQFFLELQNDNQMPNPPKMLTLFHDNKIVFLIDAADFARFTVEMFKIYEKSNSIDNDIDRWREKAKNLDNLTGDEFKECLLATWKSTFFAEYALYGARCFKRLARLSEKEMQKVYVTFTTPDKPTFMNRIDKELLSSKNPSEIAAKYPWINDGYSGVQGSAEEYFTKRLEILESEPLNSDIKIDRNDLARELEISREEIEAFCLIRKLIEFMDERKMWMMQTRRLITEPLSNIQYGWFFGGDKSIRISRDETDTLWQRYVSFKSSNQKITGFVASRGGQHLISGDIIVPISSTDNVPNGKILVVPATSPTWVPLMRNAAALITDHGGVMSHAAIVAREFGLPCIVGTKSASKILKNGDKVVIDLIKGEVNY